MGGPAPFGMRWNDGELVPDLAETAVVLDLVEVFVASGGRVKAVCSTLNGKGRRTRRGAAWSDVAVRRILNNEALPNLIPKDLWARCEPLLASRNGVAGQPKRRAVQPLGGAVHCGKCDGRMYARGKGPAGKYVCRSCRAKIDQETLETLFRSALASIEIGAGELVAALPDNPRAAELTRNLGGGTVALAEIWPLLDRRRRRQLVDWIVDRIVVDRDEVSVVFAESGGNDADSAVHGDDSSPSLHGSETPTNESTSRRSRSKTERNGTATSSAGAAGGILEPKAYRIQHVAHLLNLPKSTVYDLVRTGALASVRTGTNNGVVLVPASAVEAFLERKKRRR